MKKWLIVWIGVLFLASCSNGALEPRAVDEETDICVVCNMGISHPDYAGQVIFSNEDHVVFDDIGCLIDYVKELDTEMAAAYIKSATDDEWLDVESAYYVYNSQYWTPMNYGVLAFATEQEAKRYEEENGRGELLRYEQLLTSFDWGVHAH